MFSLVERLLNFTLAGTQYHMSLASYEEMISQYALMFSAIIFIFFLLIIIRLLCRR